MAVLLGLAALALPTLRSAPCSERTSDKKEEFMSRIISWLGACLLLSCCVLPLAAQTASNNSAPIPACQQLLMGRRYAFVFQGFVDLGLPGLTPNVGGGRISFARDGTFSAWSSLSIGGVIVPYPMHGAYQMQLDTRTKPASCSGTATASDGTTFQLVVSRDGSELEQMHTDQGLVVVINNELMEKGPCSNATLHTNYLYVANGFFAPPDYPQALGSYVPFAFSGVISFDGKGNLSGWDTVSLGGNIVPRTYTGTYDVKPHCSATMELKDTLGNDIHTVNFIYQGGKELAVINTDPGTVLAFNAKRQ